MTDTSLPSIATSLPFIAITKENFPELQRQVYYHAASVCLDNGFLTHRHGLLSFVTTIETWQQLPGNAVANGDDILFLPRDILTPPLPPADNANAWRLFDYRTKEFDKVATGVLHLTRRLKDALPIIRPYSRHGTNQVFGYHDTSTHTICHVNFRRLQASVYPTGS